MAKKKTLEDPHLIFSFSYLHGLRYGIRLYTKGTWLKMHVDRPDTHIVSCIINVDQDNDEHEPYPLQILDHDGNEHKVIMDVGDMVMYEGATCAHGRYEPFKGRYFANVFTHFKPALHQNQ